MKTLNLALTIEETNVIMKALGRLPFNEVYTLIGKINEQANQQLSGTASATSFIEKAGQNGDGN